MSSTDNFRSHCFLCEESSFKDLFGKDHFLRKCKNCGMVSSYIIPSEIELKEFYDEYPSYEKLSPLTEQRYNEILDKLEPFRKTNNLFESGCGFGFFLEEAKKRKWNVYGSELSEQAIIACERKGLPVFQDMQKITGIANGPFDAIISLEVIEHLTDPGLDVESYSQFLRPGGAVYITTPNFNSFSRYLLGKKWNVIHYPEHLHYFTSYTIDRLLCKNNFTKTNLQTSGFSPARLIHSFRLKNKNNSPEVLNYNYNEKDRELRDSIEKTIVLRLIKKIINSMLAFFKAGDSLKVLYQKK